MSWKHRTADLPASVDLLAVVLLAVVLLATAPREEGDGQAAEPSHEGLAAIRVCPVQANDDPALERAICTPD